MRLLDTSTIMLSEFFDADIPPYAILSHTWGKNEVSFQDLDHVKTKGPQAYYKIVRCCALAASKGYNWVWIDTCCIDKTSSAELSEAINSMFRWYNNSEICYAYLEDVSFDDMKNFGSSRWFTRGWTLQELLAPRDVHFYDQRWTHLGSKVSLREAVATATGISADCFFTSVSILATTSIPFQDSSVAEKMSWASKRKTSRVEDTAYCLMGLFDVNMPLLYGEGLKAFMRLQHEIVKNIDDESIFAWTDNSLSLSGMFALSPAAFVDSGDVVAKTFSQFHRSVPNTVTSRGLCIELVGKIEDHKHRELIALHCARSKDKNAPIILHIQKWNKPSIITQFNFTRTSPGKLEVLDFGRFDLRRRAETRKIYVQPLYR